MRLQFTIEIIYIVSLDPMDHPVAGGSASGSGKCFHCRLRGHLSEEWESFAALPIGYSSYPCVEIAILNA